MMTRDRCDDCYDSCSSSSLISCCAADCADCADESLCDCCCPWLLVWCCGSSGCFQEGFRGVVWCCGCVCQRRSHGIWEFESYKCGVVGKRLKSRLGWAAWMVVDFR